MWNDEPPEYGNISAWLKCAKIKREFLYERTLTLTLDDYCKGLLKQPWFTSDINHLHSITLNVVSVETIERVLFALYGVFVDLLVIHTSSEHSERIFNATQCVNVAHVKYMDYDVLDRVQFYKRLPPAVSLCGWTIGIEVNTTAFSSVTSLTLELNDGYRHGVVYSKIFNATPNLQKLSIIDRSTYCTSMVGLLTAHTCMKNLTTFELQGSADSKWHSLHFELLMILFECTPQLNSLSLKFERITDNDLTQLIAHASNQYALTALTLNFNTIQLATFGRVVCHFNPLHRIEHFHSTKSAVR
jgi:hypothetical protein